MTAPHHAEVWRRLEAKRAARAAANARLEELREKVWTAVGQIEPERRPVTKGVLLTEDGKLGQRGIVAAFVDSPARCIHCGDTIAHAGARCRCEFPVRGR